MVEARINLGVLNTRQRRIRIRMNQFDSGPRLRNTSRAPVTVSRPLMFSEAKMPMWSSAAVGLRASEDKLMGGKTWTLIGLDI